MVTVGIGAVMLPEPEPELVEMHSIAGRRGNSRSDILDRDNRGMLSSYQSLCKAMTRYRVDWGV